MVATDRPRLAVMDGLRFLAAASVLAFHFTARSNAAWQTPVDQVFPRLHHVTAYGGYGVDLFFVISGFVILMSTWGRDVPAFASSRVARLFPAYWACVLLSGVLLLWLWPAPRPTTVPQVLANLTMQQEGFGVLDVDGVYWTLWAELRFYVLMGVLVAIGLTLQRVVLVTYVWPVLGAIAAASGFTAGATILVADQAPFFAGGMALYLVMRDRRSLVAWGAVLTNLAFASTVSVDVMTRSIAANAHVRVGDTAAAVTGLVCFGLVALATLTPLRRIGWRWLTTIGLLTYPLYLLHQYWGWWMIHLVHDDVPEYVALAIATAGCLLLAYLVNRLVERRWARPLRVRLDSELRRTE